MTRLSDLGPDVTGAGNATVVWAGAVFGRRSAVAAMDIDQDKAEVTGSITNGERTGGVSWAGAGVGSCAAPPSGLAGPF